MADPNGFAMGESPPSPQLETVFSPNGTVHTVDLRSPSGVLYGTRPRRPRRGRDAYRGSCPFSALGLTRLRARCRCAGTQAHSEYGADRTYTGETYAAFSSLQRVQPERPDAALPPSALRRSMSSRVAGGSGAMEDTPGKLRRKVSWAGNTVRGRAALGVA